MIPSRSGTAMTNGPFVLAINAGSSSVKVATYRIGDPLERVHQAARDRIDWDDNAADALIAWLEQQPGFDDVQAVGHRVVHGMHHSAPEVVTPELIADLRRISPYDPDHLPNEIALIEALGRRHPALLQVACFDTAFHQTMPRVATLLPIPRRFDAMGVRRYGFHGLSYAYLMMELARIGDPAATNGRVILAHLGNGASLAAVRDGRCIDTSMGFTPVSGIPMSTRSGDLDPGLVSYLARTEHMTATAFHDMVNHKSGLLGVSETSADMRDLLAREATDVRAAEAVALFCYQVRKWIGAFAAALGGVDTLVFAGGIGEHAPVIRARISDGLGFLGIKTIRVMHTDEELMIARSVVKIRDQRARRNHEVDP